ncbi:Surp module domain-containing protein [Cryptosporidium serpentis]
MSNNENYPACEYISSSSIGLIYPPPELRAVIDKTAQFVAKNGSEFESRILSEQSNARFAFLLQDNPYNAYYCKRVESFRSGTDNRDFGPIVPQAIIDMRKREDEKQRQKKEILMLTSYESDLGYINGDVEEPKEPRPDKYTVESPIISSVDNIIIKITAMFVARNGKQFLLGLTQREANNQQFDFLKPGHALFNYFADLVEAYSLCLIPKKDLIQELKEDSKNLQSILRRCYNRYRWDYKRDYEERKKAKVLEEERQQIAEINWHEFIVVESVDFEKELMREEQGKGDLSKLPPPIDFSNLDTIIIPQPLSELSETLRSELLQIYDIEPQIIVIEEKPEESESQEEIDFNNKDSCKLEDKTKEDIVVAPDMSNIKIIKDYVRKPKRRGFFSEPNKDLSNTKGQPLYPCPITGQMIPASEMSSHLRILLLDPKWKQQKDNLLKRAQQESAFTASSDIESNLASFIAKRPDIFGPLQNTAKNDNQSNLSLFNEYPAGNIPQPLLNGPNISSFPAQPISLLPVVMPVLIPQQGISSNYTPIPVQAPKFIYSNYQQSKEAPVSKKYKSEEQN